jgi:hypothetical protein
VPDPHLAGWVIVPPFFDVFSLSALNGIDELFTLDPLFTESRSIKHQSAKLKVRVRDESLHLQNLFFDYSRALANH